MVIGWIILSVIVAALGSSRIIGFGWALVASLFLSPLIGLIIVLLSERKSDREYKDKMLRYMTGQSVSDEKDNPTLKKIAGQEEHKTNTRGGIIIPSLIGVVIILAMGYKIFNMNSREITMMEATTSTRNPSLSPSEDLIFRIKNGLAYSREEVDTTFTELGVINTVVNGFDVEKVNLWNTTVPNREQTASLEKHTPVCIMGKDNGYLLIGTPKAKIFKWGYCLPEFVKKK